MKVGKSLIPILVLFTFLVGCLEEHPEKNPSTAPTMTLNSITVLQYDSLLATILLKGSFTGLTVTPLTQLSFYEDNLCSSRKLGKGIVRDFLDPGIQVVISSFQETSIYVTTNTDSECRPFTTYSLNHEAPSVPIYGSVSPTSPSYTSATPFIFGSINGEISQIYFYDDLNCQNQVGLGSAVAFTTIGIQLSLRENRTSQIYAKTIEPFGNSSLCAFMTNYAHTTNENPTITFISISPQSPNKSSITPTLKGHASSSIVELTLFKDAACSQSLATDTPGNFADVGITVTVATNATTLIYAQGIDEENNLSTCSYLTTYINDTSLPANPIFLSFSPTSPTRQTIHPLIKGTAASSDTFVIKFYSDALCKQQIGSGSKMAFENAGISISIQENATTDVYAKATDLSGNDSSCVIMQSYTNDTLPPEPPLFTTTNPTSPNNISMNPLVFGMASDDSVQVDLFVNDSSCGGATSGTGVAASFYTTGIQLSVPPNISNTIHGVAIDSVGNISDCVSLTEYNYSNIKPPAPQLSTVLPLSPNNFSLYPVLTGTFDSTISTVNFYSDSNCQSELGSGGTALIYTTVGIVVPVAANQTTSIYAKALDVFSNYSDCSTPLINYIHDNIGPTNPTFTSFSPASPNNTSTTPTLQGSVSVDTKTIRFYDGDSCATTIGSGNGSDFTTGINITVPANSISAIYAKAFDWANNPSACTSMDSYTHNQLPPGDPIFYSTTPSNPSYSQQITLLGTIAPSSDFMPVQSVSLYSDSNCSQGNLLASGTPSVFTSTGLLFNANANTTTTVHGQTIDSVGNTSSCAPLINFVHSDAGPVLTASLSSNGSINLNWSPDPNANSYIVKRSVSSGGPYTVISPTNMSLSFKDSFVSALDNYYYVVASTNATGTSRNSNEIQKNVNPAAPLAPTNLTATPSNNLVQLFWSTNSTQMTYAVHRATQSGGPYVRLANNILVGNYSDTTANNSFSYYYVVTAENPSGISLFSNEASTVPEALPTAPTNIQGRYIPGQGYAISWSAPSYYNQFNIKRRSGNSSFLTIATLSGAASLNYIDTSPLSANSPLFENYYVVTATWGIFESLNSAEVGFANVAGPMLTSYSGNNKVILSWTSDPYAIGYRIERSTVLSGPYAVLQSSYALDTTYTDTSVNNGSVYYYRVAFNYAGNVTSQYSTESFASPNLPETLPITVHATNLTLQSVNHKPFLTWSSPGQYSSFNVYRAASNSGPFSKISSTVIPTFTDPTVPLGISYYYVKAVWGDTETTETNTVKYFNGYPTSLTAISSANDISLSWSAVSGASSYTVSRSITKNGPYDDLVVTNLVGITYTDTSVSPNQGYHYVVNANFSDGTSGDYSDVASGMAGSSVIPSGLTINFMTTTSASLSWAPVSGASGYKIYYKYSLGGSGGGPYPYSVSTTVNSSSVNLPSAAANKNCYFVVSSIKNSIESSLSAEVSANASLKSSAPLGVPGNNSINVSWSLVSNASTYSLQSSTDGINFSNVTNCFGITTTSCLDNSVINGNSYFYRVLAAFTGVGTNFYSTNSALLTPGKIPSAPTGLIVTGNSTGTSIDLSWGNVVGATSYNIKVASTSGGPYSPVANNVLSSSNVNISSLTSFITYYFVVSALIGTVESSDSLPLTVVPMSALPLTAPTATLVNNTDVSINWNSTDCGGVSASSYDVFHSEDGLDFIILQTGVASNNYLDSTAAAGPTHYYRYLPYCSGVAGSLSPSSNYVLLGVQPLIPQKLVVRSFASGAVTLDWVSVPNTNSYNIYASTSPNGPYTLATTAVQSAQPNATISGLSSPNSYYFVVTAVNSSGGESGYSNEVNISLNLAAPTNLSATAGNNSVTLSWSSVAGASNYTLKRGVASGGPFGTLVSQAGTTYTDTTSEPGTNYFYVVAAESAVGLFSENSTEVSATAFTAANLVVPIELTDQSLASDVVPITFEKTRTSLDTAAYNGTVSYTFEIVAENMDTLTKNVKLISRNNTEMASIPVLSANNQPTRLITSFTPDLQTPQDSYRLALESTTSTGLLKVYSAKILVHQVGASRTKIYIPLLSSKTSASSLDILSAAVSTNGTNYTILEAASPYHRDTSVFSKLDSYNAWELETLIATTNGATGAIAFYDLSNNGLVTNTETFFDSSSITLSSAPFSEGVTNFNASTEGHNYQVGLRCTSGCTNGSVSLYKAGLWVNINKLTKAEILYRNGLAEDISSTGSSYLPKARVMIDLNEFSNPIAYFQSVVQPPAGDSAGIELNTDSYNDSGLISISQVSNSSLSFSGSTKQWLRNATPLSFTSQYRLFPSVSSSGGTTKFNNSALIIQVRP